MRCGWKRMLLGEWVRWVVRRERRLSEKNFVVRLVGNGRSVRWQCSR